MNNTISRLLAAANTTDVLGHINDTGNFGAGDPVAALGKLISFAIQIIFLVAGLATLVFMLLGAFNWITSEGQKEKLEKAQRMIMNAVVGLILVVVAFTVFNFFMCNVLAGKFGIGCGFVIKIPRIGN